jgi:NDP-sugar pyrophosphorylase family protein
MCISLPKSEDYSRFGRVLADEHMNFVGIATESNSEWVNTGAYMLTPEIYKVPLVKIGSGEFGLPQTILSMVSQYGKKVAVTQAKFWIPIGHPEDLAKAEKILTEVKVN